MPYQPYQSTWTNPYLPQVQQPQYSPVVPSVTSAYTQPVNGVVKVNGRDSAMQYQLPPNSMSPALFDNNGKVFYMQGLREAMSTASPEEREKMMRELRTMLGM